MANHMHDPAVPTCKLGPRMRFSSKRRVWPAVCVGAASMTVLEKERQCYIYRTQIHRSQGWLHLLHDNATVVYNTVRAISVSHSVRENATSVSHTVHDNATVVYNTVCSTSVSHNVWISY